MKESQIKQKCGISNSITLSFKRISICDPDMGDSSLNCYQLKNVRNVALLGLSDTAFVFKNKIRVNH